MSAAAGAAIAVIAKAPVPGAVKTRLCPPLSPAAAAAVAEAALRDTLDAVAAASPARRVVILEGHPGSWLPDGFEALPQRGATLDERLGNGFVDLGGPALIVGMDTPQLDASMLRDALERLDRSDSVLGPALDGGYWAIGLRQPDARALLGVPMSTGRTFAAQRARLRALGLSVAELGRLRDVDKFADALAVAAAAPHTRLARAMAPYTAAASAEAA